MTLNTQVLEKITKPTHRKGASEERIFADTQKARTTAKLMAGIKASKVDRSVQRSLDIIAGRV